MKLYKNNDYYTNTLHILEVKRVQNDIYGNPLYRVYPISFLFKPLTNVYKNYSNTSDLRPYYLVQSYNIVADLDVMFEEMERENFPKLSDFDPISCGYLEIKAYIGD